MSKRFVAMAWYRREDYPRVLDIMEDADQLHLTYEKWLYDAEKAEKQIRKSGVSVVRVTLELGDFVAYCLLNGLPRNGATRAQFASELPHVRLGLTDRG